MANAPTSQFNSIATLESNDRFVCLEVSESELRTTTGTVVLAWLGASLNMSTIASGGALPVAYGGTGITSLGTGVATFLGTPSSANLLAAITDETGTGALVFANTPTLVTPEIGLATGTGLAITSANTTGTTTSSGLSIVANSLTTGTGLHTSSSSLTSGKLVNVAITGTAGATNQTGVNISLSGAHGSSAVSTYGQRISNTHTGTTSVNVALELTASGGATNYGLLVTAGSVGLGISTPDCQCHVHRGTAGSVVSSTYASITLESDDTAANDLQMLSPNTAQQRILFGDADDNDVGMIRYIHSTNTLQFLTNTAQAMSIDSSQNVGIGANASTTQKLLVSLSTSNATNIGSKVTFVSSVTANGAYYSIGLDVDLTNAAISSGVTNSGYWVGVRGDVSIINASFLGTLTYQYGIWGKVGIATCGTNGTVTNAFGLRSDIQNDHASGTITNAYGLYVDNSRTTGTITNRWGIYVDTGSSGKSYFSNNVGVTITDPTALLHLGASTTARASLCIPAGTAPTSPVNGDIWNDGSNIKVRIAGTTYTLTKT